MKKIICVVLVLVLTMSLVSVLVACNKPQSLDERDYITVGLECNYAPYNWTQLDDSNGAVKISNADGYANGYDVLIAKKVAEALGKKLVVVKYNWDALVPAVTSGSLDFIIAGMSPTADRKKVIDFSSNYYNSKLVVVVRKDGAYANAKSLDDLSGAKIVAQLGTFHDKALQAQGPAKGINVQQPLEDFSTMIGQLDAGIIDGYVAEEPGAVANCAANENFVYINLENNTTGFVASEEDTALAIGLKKGSSVLSIINQTIESISEEERIELMNKATAWSVNKIELDEDGEDSNEEANVENSDSENNEEGNIENSDSENNEENIENTENNSDEEVSANEENTNEESSAENSEENSNGDESDE